MPSVEELPEQVGLRGEADGVLVVRQHVDELVAEHRGAARLERDERHPVLDVLAQRVEDLVQEALGEAQHPVVVERATAAQGLARQLDAPAGGLEHLDRRAADRGIEVVGERVGPQDHPRGVDRPR